MQVNIDHAWSNPRTQPWLASRGSLVEVGVADFAEPELKVNAAQILLTLIFTALANAKYEWKPRTRDWHIDGYRSAGWLCTYDNALASSTSSATQ